MKIKLNFVSEQEYRRDLEAEKKQKEHQILEAKAYMADRESWCSWEYGEEANDQYIQDIRLDMQEEAYRKQDQEISRYKPEAMSADRIARRAALLQRHLARA